LLLQFVEATAVIAAAAKAKKACRLPSQR